MVLHAKDLRKGRYSLQNSYYFITSTTFNRRPHFNSFFNARVLIKQLQSSDLNNLTETIGFVVMPDHFHWLFQLKGDKTLSQVVGRVKGSSSKLLSPYVPQKLWQAGYHDRCLRYDEDIKKLLRYTIANPLRANIVESISDYPHWDCIYV
ncbi:MAG: REP-associated tyrosine transposase [Colwellia sp.]